MSTRLIPYASLEPSPWKNGGGSTTTVMVSPPGATLEDFDWRVSLATIAQDGPFSLFPGIDRTLALVDGRGVLLDFDDGRKAVLDAHNRVCEFAGEAHLGARLVDGPTIDFNLMTRRVACRHQFGCRLLDGESQFAPRGDVTLLFMAAGEYLELRNHAERMPLVRYDSVLFEPGERWTLAAREATVFVADIWYL